MNMQNPQTTKWIIIGTAVFSVAAFVLALVALASGCEGGRGGRGFEGRGQMMRNFGDTQFQQQFQQNGGNKRGGMMGGFDGQGKNRILSGDVNSGTIQ